MKNFPVLLLVYCSVNGQSLRAQSYFYNDKYYDNALVFELGVSAGAMNSLTDLGGGKGMGKKFIKDINWKTTKPCFTVYALAMYRNAVALRLETSFGSIAGYDSLLGDARSSAFGRYERNLSFKSRIIDFQLALEIHPLFFQNFNEHDPPRISPYIVVGVGSYSFDPQAKLNGQWFFLQPLRTEGQGFEEYPDRKPYKLNQLNIATGPGIKYELNSTINARLEIIYRILNTDYLDDISTTYIDPALFANYLPANLADVAKKLNDRQAELDPAHHTVPGDQRGGSQHNDAFFSIQLKIGISFGRRSR